MTRQDIADYLSLTIKTVSRTLSLNPEPTPGAVDTAPPAAVSGSATKPRTAPTDASALMVLATQSSFG